MKRRKIDEQSLVEAVFAVGFERLTLVAVAERLGTTHAALYHHVSDRASLVRLATQHLALALPSPDPALAWRPYVHFRAVSLWDMLERHPGLAAEMGLQAEPPPAVHAMWERDLAQLTTAGFTPEDAALALDTVIDLPFDVAARARTQARVGLVDAPGKPQSREWFLRKLDIVLDGIAVGVAPRGSGRSGRSGSEPGADSRRGAR